MKERLLIGRENIGQIFNPCILNKSNNGLAIRPIRITRRIKLQTGIDHRN